MAYNFRRVLITGGAGLIGSHIVDCIVRGELQDSIPEIIILDNFVRGRLENLSESLPQAPVTLIEGDVRHRELLAEIMADVDLVFHQAAIRITQCAEEPRLAVDVLVNGTFNVVEQATAFGVKKVVAASSASVYGMADAFPTHETHHPYNNRTIYGAAKTFNEGLLRSFNEMYGLDYVALRYFNVYGPRMDVFGAYTEVLIRWMERIEIGLPPVIFGNGRQTMDFVHVRDVARANIAAARSDVSDMVFNVASGRETSLRELAEALLEVMGSRLSPEFGPERSINPVQRRLADTRAAEELLGFRTQVSLEEGLRELVSWWRNEREALGQLQGVAG